jgi:hypothetical protein
MKKNGFLFCLSLLFFLLFFPSISTALERFDILSTLELEQMLKQRSKGEIDFVLVNALDEVIFRNSHIPGSVSLPLSRVDELIDRLGTDPDRLIVPY